MTAFTTERERGDNLGLSTVELRYAVMDSRTALLHSSVDIFHTIMQKVLIAGYLHWSRRSQHLVGTIHGTSTKVKESSKLQY